MQLTSMLSTDSARDMLDTYRLLSIEVCRNHLVPVLWPGFSHGHGPRLMSPYPSPCRHAVWMLGGGPRSSGMDNFNVFVMRKSYGSELLPHPFLWCTYLQHPRHLIHDGSVSKYRSIGAYVKKYLPRCRLGLPWALDVRIWLTAGGPSSTNGRNGWPEGSTANPSRQDLSWILMNAAHDITGRTREQGEASLAQPVNGGYSTISRKICEKNRDG